MKSFWIPAVGVVTALVAVACSPRYDTIGLPLAERTVFDVNWDRFSRLPGSKAFALAGKPDGRNAIGLAYGMDTPAAARARALDYCEEERKARSIDAPCTLLAVDKTVLGDAERRLARSAPGSTSDS